MFLTIVFCDCGLLFVCLLLLAFGPNACMCSMLAAISSVVAAIALSVMMLLVCSMGALIFGVPYYNNSIMPILIEAPIFWYPL